MLVFSTQKLAGTMKIKVVDVVTLLREPLYDWHAHLFVYNWRKGVILMNNQTFYCIVIYGLVATDFKKFESIAFSAIKQTFLAEGLPEDAVSKYIRHGNEVIFAKSYDRSILGQISEALYQLELHIVDYIPSDSIYMIELSKRLSRMPVSGKSKYAFPIDGLREELGRL